jgi:hypothetical protein
MRRRHGPDGFAHCAETARAAQRLIPMQTVCLLATTGDSIMNGIWIPIVAILATFAVPITAILADLRRRQLQSEERKAMIERGMQPPEHPDRPIEFGRWGGDRSPAARRERALMTGITMLCLGVGLALAAFLIGYVIADSFIPSRLVGPLALGASVVGFLGIGNLIYYVVSGRKAADSAS